MKLLLDGIVFQARSDPTDDLVRARTFWSGLIRALVQILDLQIVVLDRGGMAAFDDVEAIPFPSHDGRYNAADSELLQKVADLIGAEVFMSTGWTTPLRLPSLLILGQTEADETPGAERAMAEAFSRQRLLLNLSDQAVDVMARAVHDHLAAILACRTTGLYEDFFDRWSSLRLLHVSVEI